MEAIAYALIATIVFVLTGAGVLIHRQNELIARHNEHLLAAVVADTPKDFGILTKPPEDRGLTPSQQARHDQEQALRRQLESEMDDHLKGLGYEDRQIGI